jgi:predicted signal transduction protein with EAL and GGDEF domain
MRPMEGDRAPAVAPPAARWNGWHVDVSASTPVEGTRVDDVAAVLDSSGVPAERLVVEPTETTVAADPRRAAGQFAALRLPGVEAAPCRSDAVLGVGRTTLASRGC